MKKLLITLFAAGLLFTLSCEQKDSNMNPLLSEWNTPFGIPPFEDIKLEHYMPAYLKAMEIHKAEIDSIVNNSEEPTFENTIVAYDNSGSLLDKITPVFSSLNSVNSNKEVMALAKELSPLTSRHYNDISLNDKLFARIKVVFLKKDSLNLSEEQMRLLTEMYKGFERSGANLSEEKKQELKKINEEISNLHLAFGQNLLSETNNFKLIIEKEEDLAGLSPALIAAASQRASADSSTAGKWVFGLDNPSVMPFLQQAANRELRRQILEGYLNRCNNNNEFDNKEIITKILDLKIKRAALLGYDNFASYQLEDRMAKKPEAVYDLLDRLWKPALLSAKAELSDMKALAAQEGFTDELQAWDWRYYFEKSLYKKV